MIKTVENHNRNLYFRVYSETQEQSKNVASPVSDTPNDTFRKSSDAKKNESLKLIGIILGSALLLAGGLKIAHKVFRNFSDQLACHIKRGEISDKLYDFIKRQDPGGRIFKNKSEILELNSFLNENKDMLVTFKKIAKCNGSEHCSYGVRFSPPDILDMLKSVNKDNLPALEQMLSKGVNEGWASPGAFSAQDIADACRKINATNTGIAKDLIEVATKDLEKIGYDEEKKEAAVKLLHKLLGDANESNADIYNRILGTRRNGSIRLTMEEIDSLTRVVNKENIGAAEFFLGLKDSSGINYRLDIRQDLPEVLKHVKSGHVEQYSKIFETPAIEITEVLPKLNEDNIDLAIKLSKHPANNYQTYISDKSWSACIEQINADTKDYAAKVFERFKDDPDFDFRGYRRLFELSEEHKKVVMDNLSTGISFKKLSNDTYWISTPHLIPDDSIFKGVKTGT